METVSPPWPCDSLTSVGLKCRTRFPNVRFALAFPHALSPWNCVLRKPPGERILFLKSTETVTSTALLAPLLLEQFSFSTGTMWLFPQAFFFYFLRYQEAGPAG